MKKIKISPSILSCDFANLECEIKTVEKAGADILHFDIMDGHFVPNITFGPIILSSLRNKTNLLFNAHLMIENPDNFIDDFISSGADIVSVHPETTKHLHRTIWKIKDKGKKVGVALSPAVSDSVIDYVLQDIDIVMVMTVNPGFAGQKFIPQMLDKIISLKRKIQKKNLKVEIEVDGGINDKTAPLAVKAGADILVAASYIFQNRNNLDKIVKELRKLK